MTQPIDYAGAGVPDRVYGGPMLWGGKWRLTTSYDDKALTIEATVSVVSARETAAGRLARVLVTGPETGRGHARAFETVRRGAEIADDLFAYFQAVPYTQARDGWLEFAAGLAYLDDLVAMHAGEERRLLEAQDAAQRLERERFPFDLAAEQEVVDLETRRREMRGA